MHVVKNIFLILCCLLFLSQSHSLRAAEYYQTIDSDIDLKTLCISTFIGGLFVGSIVCQCTELLWPAKDHQAFILNHPKKTFVVGFIAGIALNVITPPLYNILKNNN